ncbi:endonuclease/exonuclease/phosphatase family protein [uncultured Hymenobacter sp.]|uniref:endonuclease/exonuclease/phosphatase family protein n=1 Tax=uncultured Hymenobacter sp. TaxID=170016 RepID=UPI0035CBB176
MGSTPAGRRPGGSATFARVRRSFAFQFTLLVLLGLLLGIAAEQVPAGRFWPAAFIALTVPGWLLLLALLILYWLRRNWRGALLPALALALCWPQVRRGLALNPFQLKVKSEELKVRTQRDGNTTFNSSFLTFNSPNAVRLLSANVRIFNVYAHLRDPDYTSSRAMTAWLAESPADILCLQEFYHEPRPFRDRSGVFNAAQRLGPGSGRHAFVSKSLTNGIGAEFGLAIFSRFAIVRRGVIAFGGLSQNHAMWADLRRPAAPAAGRPRADTIRVFNLHLQSMSLDEKDIVTASRSTAGFGQKGRGLLRQFRNGAVKRGWQIDTVVARVRRSPYPVLLAGDLNDLPYSYPYDQLADHLQNAWELGGFGFGATYNGKLPGLRIDQQFAGPQWRVLGCRVHREIPYSDHFPVEAGYELR